MASLILLPILIGLMYVFLILPQQRRVREHKALIEALQIGDEVMTTAGMYGRVTHLDDELALLEIAPGVEVRVARGAIGRRLVDPEPAELDAGDEDTSS